MIDRVLQFARALAGGPSPQDLAWAKGELAEGERRLFEELSGAEQAHAVRVAKRALALAQKAGVPETDRTALVKAALLHDIGKCGAVGLSDKVAIVLAKAFLPALARRLCRMGEREVQGAAKDKGRPAPAAKLARAFYFDRIHPERGAEMAGMAGAGGRVVALIRDHHAPSSGDPLLAILSQADRGA